MIDHDIIAHGTPAACRALIHAMLALAQVQADLGPTYAAIGDDAGLEYVARGLVAYTRAVIATLIVLKAMKEDSHAR